MVATGCVRWIIRLNLDDASGLCQREMMGSFVLIETHHVVAPAVHCCVVVLLGSYCCARQQKQTCGYCSDSTSQAIHVMAFGSFRRIRLWRVSLWQQSYIQKNPQELTGGYFGA